MHVPLSRRRTRRVSPIVAGMVVAAGALVVLEATPAYGVGFSVNSPADAPDAVLGNGVCLTAAGTCTLRAAIEETEAAGGTNTIAFALPTPSIISLTSPLPVIDDQTALTIAGPGPDKLTVRRLSGGDYPVFRTEASDVTLSGMTITNGLALAPSGIFSGGGVSSLFGSLVLDDVAIIDNHAVASGDQAFAIGGGVFVEQGDLTVRHSVISDNSAEAVGDTGQAIGGGVGTTLALEIDIADSTIDQNTVTATGPGNGSVSGGGFGGSANTIQITRSTVSNNAAATNVSGPGSGSAYGGGINAFAGSLVLASSTVDHNAASVSSGSAPLVLGGGLYVSSTPTVVVTNSTISSNAATADPAGVGAVVAGGGLDVLAGTVSISSSTIAFNRAPQGANLAGAANALKLRSTVVTDPVGGGGDCYEAAPDTIISDGYNLASDASCGLEAPSDLPAGTANLKALAHNGGPTRTHALPANSPAIDKGNAAGGDGHPAAATDQRGLARPFDRPAVPNAIDGTDIGAFERSPIDDVPVAGTNAYRVTGGATLRAKAPGVLANDAGGDGSSLTARLVRRPATGTLRLSANGSFTYLPSEDAASGVVTFTYRATDGTHLSAPATVRITVTAGCNGIRATKVGTQRANRITGTRRNDVINGRGGHDVISGVGGRDVICGGTGRDTISAGPGNDLIIGGSGNDLCLGQAGADRIRTCERGRR